VREAKRRLALVRNAPEARSEARGVAERHGSRRDRRGAMQQDPVRRTLGRGGPPREAPRAPDPQRLLPFAAPDGGDAPDGGIDPGAPPAERE
jgi:hypothetical protein